MLSFISMPASSARSWSRGAGAPIVGDPRARRATVEAFEAQPFESKAWHKLGRTTFVRGALSRPCTTRGPRAIALFGARGGEEEGSTVRQAGPRARPAPCIGPLTGPTVDGVEAVELAALVEQRTSRPFGSALFGAIRGVPPGRDACVGASALLHQRPCGRATQTAEASERPAAEPGNGGRRSNSPEV